jgi:hypothetical protein
MRLNEGQEACEMAKTGEIGPQLSDGGGQAFCCLLLPVWGLACSLLWLCAVDGCCQMKAVLSFRNFDF